MQKTRSKSGASRSRKSQAPKSRHRATQPGRRTAQSRAAGQAPKRTGGRRQRAEEEEQYSQTE